jgi:hypothetical protein
MTRALPDSLRELIGFGGFVLVKCRKCGREARFTPGSLSEWFRSRGQRDDWKTIRRKFVCKGWGGEGCGSRLVEVSYVLEAPEPPRQPPVPRDDCPNGINPIAWARADVRERKRLMRQLR